MARPDQVVSEAKAILRDSNLSKKFMGALAQCDVDGDGLLSEHEYK